MEQGSPPSGCRRPHPVGTTPTKSSPFSGKPSPVSVGGLDLTDHDRGVGGFVSDDDS
jgi:hypothetical protein